MTNSRSVSCDVSLVNELRGLPRSTEWVKFKVNGVKPQVVGAYILALANAAALVGKAVARLGWGVRDENQAVARARTNYKQYGEPMTFGQFGGDTKQRAALNIAARTDHNGKAVRTPRRIRAGGTHELRWHP